MFDDWLKQLQKLRYDEDPEDIIWSPLFRAEAEPVESEQVDSGRWEETIRSIYFFMLENRYLAIEQNLGLTEMQDADPDVKAYEVWPVSVQVTKFVSKKPE